MDKIINIGMGIQKTLSALLNDRLILSEVYHSGHKINLGRNAPYVEVFKNPDMSEIDDVVDAAHYDGAKIGTDDKGDVYVWVDDVMHSIMEKALKMHFVLRFDYTKGNPILFLAQGMTEDDWEKHGDDKLIKRIKDIFQDITSIEMVSRPFTVVHTYK